MSETYDAFGISPVPAPGPDAVPPEPYRGIYGMPMFVTLPSGDLAASTDFWTAGLGFVELFSVPGQVTHLRRWAFQDVLLVPGEPTPSAGVRVSFACVLSQLESIAQDCDELRPGCVTGPREMPWNSVECEVRTPEGARVVMTAAKPLDPDGDAAQWMRQAGLDVP